MRPILEHLREAFRRAGHGSMQRTVRRLELHRTYYSAPRDRFDVGVLRATLRELDVSPGAFFAELEGGAGGMLGALDRARERSTPETRQAVRKVYRRMRAELPGVDLVAELEDGAGTVAATPPALGMEWLEGLDARRQDEPEAVSAAIVAGLDQVEPALLPRALGVWCSALRLTLELEAAAYLNRWALRLAEAAGDSATVADLYRLKGFIIADATGDYRQALVLAELAVGIFTTIGDQIGIGRTLVDCASRLHYLSRIPEAIHAARQALDVLPENETRHRLAALHSLGLLYLDCGSLAEAEGCVSSAEPLAEDAGLMNQGKLRWLRGLIAHKRTQLLEAERDLRQAFDIFRQIHPGEAALSAVDLIKVLLKSEKPGEARQTCWSMLPLLGPLEENPIICAAVGDLVRTGLHGVLTLDSTREIEARIKAEQRKNARTRRQWHALANQ